MSAEPHPAASSAIVVTTINSPTTAIAELARGAQAGGIPFVVIGDERTPDSAWPSPARYLDLKEQRALPFSLARLAPASHYARKNLGYLCAIAGGADVVIETDDDNMPLAGFWEARRLRLTAAVVRHDGWVNAYRHFTEQPIWPRGFPLEFALKARGAFGSLPVETLACPIQQGLADGNPDVDAIYRLLMPLPVSFESSATLLLADNAWCPFNSQNTTWWLPAFQLLYLPFSCSMRMTDIVRSFVARRIAAVNGWALAFHGATVRQDRNVHDLLQDFEQEIPGYLNSARVKRELDVLELDAGAEHIAGNLQRCYATLQRMGIVEADEAALLDAWIADVAMALTTPAGCR